MRILPKAGKRPARWTSMAVAVTACVVLFGWVTGSQLLTSFIPGPAATRVGAAFAFLLAAVAVWGVTSSRLRTQRAGLVCALLASLLALESLAARSWAPVAGFHRSLPSGAGERPLFKLIFVPTAIGIVWACLALWLSVWLARGAPLGRGRGQRAVAWLFDGLVAALLALGTMGILVALYGWHEASALAALRETALPSSLAITGLGIAIAFVRAERGIGRALLDPGPAGVLLRRLLPAAVLVPPSLGFIERFVRPPAWLAGYGGAPF